ncbi:hypothetical protein F5148DRAFT_1286433 [Russula earlei]|uniref:Uncharacterized protein n=1 Tax=Russula earlei TaxID=71964 RepID=A0ACC0U422_9AGAM|nr:hypothetical protein F5148DRAFT_1286433 [Russula earlei]
MSQNEEATQFLSRVVSLPKGPVSLDNNGLQPSLDDEAELRKLFATDRGNTRLKDIHVGLVDVFAAPPHIRTTRARVVASDADRSSAMVEILEIFKKNWGVFTENSLSQLSDWSNVLAARGSVQACLMPPPKVAMATKRTMRKRYHEKAFPSSDVDLLLYDLTTQEAERKIVAIYEAVRDSVPWDVTCIRTKHTVSIHSQYPYRNIQIVLRLYSSPAEILAGFDIDAPCCAYDGNRVWPSPRAIISMMRQSLTVDMTRRSPSYEVRLAKYCSRGFEVYIPGLKRSEIDPTIFERAVGRIQGLARLLAIEKLAAPGSRNQYQYQRSILRGRPADISDSSTRARLGRRYKNDLKADPVFSGLALSDYDIANLHIPYGLGWDARRIGKLIYKTDFGVNTPYNPKNKNRRLHRHSAFFGTMEECMEDCCEHCPQPRNAEEHGLQDEEDKIYVRGRIGFIQEDPGRQCISGSFNPIDEGEWGETAYTQATAKFFGAISKDDTVTVTQMIKEGEDVNRRDHVGRTALHLAILSNSVEVASVLIDAGARMTARLVGGRTTFHLAAQMAEKDADPLEDDNEAPDVLDLSTSDWDFGLTALGHAILFGSPEVVDVLLTAGADPNFAARAKGTRPLHPLTLTIHTQDEECAVKIAERLIASRAISSTADENLLTILHRVVLSGKTKIAASLLSRDSNAKKILNIPASGNGIGLVFPVVSSILSGDYATLAHYSRVYLPVEVAFLQRDQIISLLAALGATVDASIKTSNWQPLNLLQWTSAIVADLWTPNPPAIQRPSSPPDDTWAAYRAYLMAARFSNAKRLHNTWNVLAPELNKDNGVATRDYYMRADSILRSHSSAPPSGAPQTVQTTAVPTNPAPGHTTLQESGYIRHARFGTIRIPAYLKMIYDELYEACWTGDSVSVQELCLPKHIAEDKEPIQISVQTTALNIGFGVDSAPRRAAPSSLGNARLVIAIATAQYQDPDAEAAPIDPVSSILSDDDSDEGSCTSEDYSEPKEINFVDLAARPSAVRAEAPPKKMLKVQSSLRTVRKFICCTPLQKAVYDDDFEAFVRILELYQFAGAALWPDGVVHELVVKLDRPDMLDELTRRTGVGIPFLSEKVKTLHMDAKVVEERVYLGLKVGGKRRADMAQQGQSKQKVITYNYDLLRSAIFFGAAKVVEYLAGPRSLAAYTYYASTYSDDIAQYLKSIDNLSAALPALLGWQLDELNESPLLCAVKNNKLEILKQLFALKPNLMVGMLHQRTKFVGFNALLTAAYYCSSSEIVDFVLERGCDPRERDPRGWNIYHLACLSENAKRFKFIIHLLKTLPKELTHELMTQRSKASNTPLMLAVKRRYPITVRTILEFGVNPATDSNTALVEILLQYGPTEHMYTENSVGQTPLEVAFLKYLPRVAERDSSSWGISVAEHITIRQKQKVEIPKLRKTLDALLADGCLIRGTKLATELLSFADRLEEKLATEVAKKGAASDVVEEENEYPPVPSYDAPARCYTRLRDAAVAHPGCRRLVHLTDVQQSVQRGLRLAQETEGNDEEPIQVDPEEQHIAQLKARSLFTYRPVFDYNYKCLTGVNLFADDQF